MRQLAVLALLAFPALAPAQNPLRHFTDAVDVHSSRSQPKVSYTLTVNPEDLSGYAIEMRISNAPDTVRLAFAAHPEYDDKYWRYIEALSTDGSITREDSSLWRLATRAGSATVRYRIKLPPAPDGQRAAWKPFLSSTGGLVGGPHSFMYIVGATLAPSYVTLDVPRGWQVATGLAATVSPHTWFAATTDALMDSPMLVGQHSTWSFLVDGTPHRVAYWRSPSGQPFDSAAFVRGIQGIAQQAISAFGRAPYRDFTFVMQDNAYGGLEHRSSVTLGAPSADLARNVSSHFPEIAHEFTHTWNLMRIRPEEYGDVTYKTQVPVAGLWFSEGLTMHYADIFMRRAGLPISGDSTRKLHLEYLLGRYFNSAGNQRFSAERISQVEYNNQPGALGDYSPSVHLVGEVLGNLLDIIVRDATDNRRSMEDVMRLMLECHSGTRGFNGRDIERAVRETCGCNVHDLFEAKVRGARTLDVNQYLKLAGLRMDTTVVPARNRDSTLALDLRFRAWPPDNGGAMRIIVTDPTSTWGRAGLHTNDELLAINGQPVKTWPEVARFVTSGKIGDTLRFEVRQKGVVRTRAVGVSGYSRVVPTLVEVSGVSEKVRRIRAAILLQQQY